MDEFARLGLPRRFDLTRQEIQRAYLARIRDVHPDSGAAEALAEQDDSAAASLNKAKATLDDPEARADALVVLLGGPRRDADRTLPGGFLAEMLEVREQIEAAKAADNRSAMAEWHRWAESRRASHVEKVAELFRSAVPMTGEILVAIRRELNAWRYVERLREQM